LKLIIFILIINFSLPLLAEEKKITFNNSVKLIEIGMYSEAIINLEILYISEKTPRIELELARAYFGKGEYKRSKTLFLKVKNNPLTPDTVKQKINYFLTQIKSIKDGFFSFNFELIEEKNPRKEAKSGSYNFFGIPLQYESENKGKIKGYLLSVDHTKPLAKNTFLKSYIEFRDLEGGGYDSNRVFFSYNYSYDGYDDLIGLFINFDNNSNIDNESFGFFLNKDFEFLDNNYSFSINSSKHNYTNFNLADGYDLTPSFSNFFNLYGNENAKITYLFGKYFANDSSYSNFHQGLKFQSFIDFMNSKVKINYGLEFYQFKNDGYDIFWNKKRKGNIKSLFYSLCIDKFKEKISPCLNIRYEENIDSIRFYSYSNFFMSFSFKY